MGLCLVLIGEPATARGVGFDSDLTLHPHTTSTHSSMQGILCLSERNRQKGDGQTDTVNCVTGCGVECPCGLSVPQWATEFPVEAHLPELLDVPSEVLFCCG